MSNAGFKVSGSSFLVDSRINETVFVVCCDDTTTIFELGIQALEEHKRTFPVLEGELNPILQYVSDSRGRILSGSLKVMNVDYLNGLEIILNDNNLNVSSSSSSSDNNNVINNNSILNAISTFNSDQEKLAQHVVSHLQMLKEQAISSSSSASSSSSLKATTQPLPEVMNLLSQISNSTNITIQTYALQAYDILCNTILHEHKRFMFNTSLVGIGVRSIQEIYNTTTHAEIANQCMDILMKHVSGYILIHSVMETDLVGVGLHSTTSQLLGQGNEASALRAQLNKQIIQQSSATSPLQLDVDALQTDTEQAMIRFHINTKLQGKLLKSCTDIVATLSELGLYHTSSDNLLQNAVDVADKNVPFRLGSNWKNTLGLGKSSNANKKGKGKLDQTASAPLLSIKTMKKDESQYEDDHEDDLEVGSEGDDDEDDEFDGDSAISQSPSSSLASSGASDGDVDNDSENAKEEVEENNQEIKDDDTQNNAAEGSLSVSSSEHSLSLSVLEEGDEDGADQEDGEKDEEERKNDRKSKSKKKKKMKEHFESRSSLGSYHSHSSNSIDNHSTTSSIASHLKVSSRSNSDIGSSGSRGGRQGRGRTFRPSASEPMLSSKKVQPPLRKRLIQVEGGKLMEIIQEVGIKHSTAEEVLSIKDGVDEINMKNHVNAHDDVDIDSEWSFPPASPRSRRLQVTAHRHLIRTGVSTDTMSRFNLVSSNAASNSSFSSPFTSTSIAMLARKYLLSGEKSLVQHFLDSLLYSLSSTHYSMSAEMAMSPQTGVLPAIRGLDNLKKTSYTNVSTPPRLKFTNSDVFEVAILVAAVLRNTLQPSPSNNNNSTRSFEGMAEALLLSPLSDLNRAFQCTLILQLLTSHLIPMDEDPIASVDDAESDSSSTIFYVNNTSNGRRMRYTLAMDAVLAAMHAPTPPEVYSKLADTYETTVRSSTLTAPMRIVFTLAHWTDRSLIWNSNSTATAMGDLADSCLELFCISVYHNCRMSPSALVLHQNNTSTTSHGKRDMTLELINHLSTTMTMKYLKLSEKKVFGPHLYVALVKVLSVLNQYGPASREYAEALSSNDYAIASWLIHYTPLVVAKSIKDSSMSWEMRAIEWISDNGNHDIEMHKKILSINHWADEPVYKDQEQVIVGAGFPSVIVNNKSNKSNPISLNSNSTSNQLSHVDSNASIVTVDTLNSHNSQISQGSRSIASKAILSKHSSSNTSLSLSETQQLQATIDRLIPYGDLGETPMILTTIAAAAVNKPCRDFLLRAGLISKLVNIIGSLVHSCVIVYRAKDDGKGKDKSSGRIGENNEEIFIKPEQTAEQQAKQASMASFLEKRRSVVPAFGAHKSASTSSIGGSGTGSLMPLSARAMAEQAAQAAEEAEKKRKEAQEEEKKKAKEKEEEKAKAAEEAEKEALLREQELNRAWIDPIAIRQNTPLISLALKALANLCYADPDTAQTTGSALIETLERRVRLKTLPTSILNAHINSINNNGKENSGGLNPVPSTLSDVGDGDELLPKIKRNHQQQQSLQEGGRLSVQEQIAKYNHIDHYHYIPEDNDNTNHHAHSRPVLYDESRVHAMHCVLRRMAGVDKAIVLYLTFLDCSNPFKMPTTDPQTAHNQLTAINNSNNDSNGEQELNAAVASARAMSIKDTSRGKDTARSNLSIDTSLSTARSDAMSVKLSPRKLAKIRKTELAMKAALGFRSKVNKTKSGSHTRPIKAKTEPSILE